MVLAEAEVPCAFLVAVQFPRLTDSESPCGFVTLVGPTLGCCLWLPFCPASSISALCGEISVRPWSSALSVVRPPCVLETLLCSHTQPQPLCTLTLAHVYSGVSHLFFCENPEEWTLKYCGCGFSCVCFTLFEAL